MVQREFLHSFNVHISKQHERFFKEYFNEDLSNKTFTDNEFCRLFQVGPVLGIIYFRPILELTSLFLL